MLKLSLVLILMSVMLVPSASAQSLEISCMEFVNSTTMTVCWGQNGEFTPLPEDGGRLSMLEPLQVEDGFTEEDAQAYVEAMMALDAVRESDWQMPELLFLTSIMFVED